MSTHLPGFRSFFICFFLHHFVLAKLATSSIRVNVKPGKQGFLYWILNPANAEATFIQRTKSFLETI